MTDKLLISTRKGLFTVSRKAGQWGITAVDFLGDNVTLSLTDTRDGRCYVALDHGHFGVKLHRSANRGETWTEISAPEYPAKPDGFIDKDIWGNDREWVTKGIWALEPALDADGGLWCGTRSAGPWSAGGVGQVPGRGSITGDAGRGGGLIDRPRRRTSHEATRKRGRRTADCQRGRGRCHAD